MKKVLCYLITILLIGTMTMGITGCTSKASEIKDTLSEFEYACRDLDVNAMLKCIDPDIADPIRLGLALVSTFTDADYEDLVDGLFDNIGTSEFGSSFNAEDFLSTISVSDAKLKIKKQNATVTCKINFELAGEQFKRDATIKMIKKDDKWYICSFDMFSSNE
jgi:hypothetical protein